MYIEGFDCDRKGCKNHTAAIQPTELTTVPNKYPYKEDTWIRRTTIENGQLCERDFCSLECEIRWLESQIEGKK